MLIDIAEWSEAHCVGLMVFE